MLIAVALILLPPARRFSMFSVAAIMLAWAWSFEAAIYSTFVYIVFLVVSAACAGSTTRHAIATAGRSLALLSVLLIAFVVVVLTAYVATIGKIPRYDLYLSIVLAYVGPDPFMEYAFYQNGFLAWVPVLTGYFVAICLIARQCFARKVRKAEWTTQLAVITALGLTIGVYCIISTQTFILKVVLLPVFLLLYWAIDAGVTARTERDAVSATELGLGPVLVFVAFLLTGFSVGNFAGPPVYGTPNASILRHLLSYGRPLPKDFAPRLHRSCNPTGVTEPGSVCAPSAMPAAHHDELVQLLTRWQSDSPTLLMFHPADALMTVYLQKPHALPVSFAYVDGFSPALFRNIVERAETVIERDFRPSQVLVAAKDLATLNELEWALLTRVAALWRLEQVDETAHVAAYRLTREPLRATGRILVLPDRPIRSRNTF